ncbi:MAG: delta-1-pyrroline-5-carboxylate dehydrogenase, partial [Noviherbaspirillum sp.]
AWACGNAVAVDPETASLLPSDFPQALRDRVGLLGGSGDPALAPHLALLEGPRASQARMALAEHEGMIVPAIETAGRARIPLWRLVAERALCVNTTAAGGNASLMAMEE